MIHLKSVRLGTIDQHAAGKFPFSVPVIAALAGCEIAFSSEVTLLVGENGSGKSTFLEALAIAARSIAVASEDIEGDRTLAAVRQLARKLKLSWSKRTRAGFFMRSEDFFGFAKRMRALRESLEREMAEIGEEFADRSTLAQGLARMPFMRELHEMKQLYGEDLDANSHGESYFMVFKARFSPNGLYLLDEPEAPLSPMRQIGLMAMIKMMVEEQGAQFIISTHSPILMAYPSATIYTFDGGAIRQAQYQELEHVTVTRAFLSHPERFLRHL